MRRKSPREYGVTTRDLILDAAVLRFSRHSYEETALRDVAADVGVDVAYVHRCFGSKEQLFAKAVAAVIQPGQLVVDARDKLARTFSKQVLKRDAARKRGDVGPLDIVVRSLSSPDASRVLREFILNDFIDPLARKLDHPAATRAALIAAFLTGFGILRNVLAIDPLVEVRNDVLEHLIAHIIQNMMDADSIAQRLRST